MDKEKLKKNNTSSDSDYGKRSNQAKKEIAELRQELEKLLNCKVKDEPLLLETTNINENIEIQADLKSTIINEVQKKNPETAAPKNYHDKCTIPHSLLDSYGMKNARQKIKTYDKEAAKEYIKHQREKWREERQKLDNKAKIDQEIKKQKLNDLQQKSLALVQRNLQSKKQQSKSRERRDEIRLDKNRSSPVINNINRSRVQLKFEDSKTRKELFVSKSPKAMQKKSCSESKLNEFGGKENKTPLPLSSNKNLLGKKLSKNGISSTSNPSMAPVDQDEAATRIQNCYRGYLSRKNNDSQKHDTIECNMKTQETQTSARNRKPSPIRLPVPSIDPYPCNFIKTVRRKLQNVINSPVNYRDVGIQNSIIGTYKNHEIKSKSETAVNLQNGLKSEEKSEFKSFASHKRNLDASALRHLALVHHHSRKNDVDKLQDTDSESDTSKNIPEISSESGSISNNKMKNAQPVSKGDDLLVISTDKIKNMCLRNSNHKNENKSDRFLKVPDPFDDINLNKNFSRKSYTFNFYNDENKGAENKKENDKSGLSSKSVTSSSIEYNSYMNKDIPKNVTKSHSKPIEDSKNWKSPDDSILSFNKSEYNVYNPQSIPGVGNVCDTVPKSLINGKSSDNIRNGNDVSGHEMLNFAVATDSNDEIKTEISNETSSISSLRSVNSNRGLGQSKVTIERGSLRNLATDKYVGESNKKELIKNIEKSLDTSLISHISEKGSNSSQSSSQSKKYNKANELADSNVSSEENNTDIVSEINTKFSSSKSSSDDIQNIPYQKIKSGLTSSKSTISSVSMTSSRRELNSKAPSKTTVDELKDSNSSTKQIVSEKSNEKERTSEFMSLYSSNYSSGESSAPDNLKLKHSKSASSKEIKKSLSDASLKDAQESIVMKFNGNEEVESQLVKNISGRLIPSKTERNEIHLKFEAEVHLLNDFNESIKQFMAVEKAFESIKNKNENTSRNSSNLELFNDSKISTNLSKSLLSSVNTSRSTDLNDCYQFSQEKIEALQPTVDSTELEITRKSDNYFDSNEFKDGSSSNLAGLSIKMFDQLIRDEDVRIENLKTIIKIREQALLDRTKGELAWLEIQRKQLKETGKLHEASLVKKKQRGILLKHQQERREMQRLKQLQTKKSNERKTILKEQRNLIKAKLTSERMMSEMKIHNTPRKRRSSGPMRVFKSSESIHSETSISRKNSDGEEILSIMSRKSSIRMSEIESSWELMVGKSDLENRSVVESKSMTDMKKVLFMRQTALMKRRRAVEDLLQKHQKLLEEEKKIEQLEMAANAVITQMPTMNQQSQMEARELRMKGQQLNELIQKMGSSKMKRYVDNKTYLLPKSSYNKLLARLKNERSHVRTDDDENIGLKESSGKKEIINVVNDEDKETTGEFLDKTTKHTDNFESDTQDIVSEAIEQESEEQNISSLSELIQDFSQIQKGITSLSTQFDDEVFPKESVSSSENLTESIKDSSVIETSKLSPKIDNEEKTNNSKFSIESEIDARNVRSSSGTQELALVSSVNELSVSGSVAPSMETSSELVRKVEEAEKGSENDMSNVLEIADEDVSSLIHAMVPASLSESTDFKEEQPMTVASGQLEDADELATDLETFLGGSEVKEEENIVEDGPELATELDDDVVIESNDLVSSEAHLDGKSCAVEPKITSNDLDSPSIHSSLISAENNSREDQKMSKVNSMSSESHLMSELSKKEEIEDFEDSSRKKSVDEIEETSENSSGETQNDVPTEEMNEASSNLDDNISPYETENVSDIIEEEETPNRKNNSLNKTYDIDSFSKTILNNENLMASVEFLPYLDKPEGLKEDLNDRSLESIPLSNNIKSSLSEDSNGIIEENSAEEETKNILHETVLKNEETSKEDLDPYSYSLSNFETVPTSEEVVKTEEEEEFSKNVVSISETHEDLSSAMGVAELFGRESSESPKVVEEDLTAGGDYTDDFEDDSAFKDSSSGSNKDSNAVSLSENSDSDSLMMVKIDITAKEVEVSVDGKMEKNRGETLPEVGLGEEVEEKGEISTETNDKDGRVEEVDSHVTTYEDVTPATSPELAPQIKISPSNSINMFGNEAEELLKKQLAIEQEIKHLEQQQKEQMPFVYMREIPNKPPPPYTPPSVATNPALTILPAKVADVTEICNYSAKVLYNAYLSNNLDTVTFSESHFESINETKSTRECCLFVFDLCREVAKQHYRRFEKQNNVPLWLKVSESRATLGKPFDYVGLEKHINVKVKELLGFGKPTMRENSSMKWSRKKKDHVDEVLVLESKAEEHEWLNYDKDELIVKDELTNEIFNGLLNETIEIFRRIFP